MKGQVVGRLNRCRRVEGIAFSCAQGGADLFVADARATSWDGLQGGFCSKYREYLQ